MTTGRIKQLAFSEGVVVSAPATATPVAVQINVSTGWDGVVTTNTYDVSASVADARTVLWLLKNSSYKQLAGPEIDSPSATQVRITADVPLAAGTYYLFGVY